MRTRWRWLLALTAALAAVVGGIWQRREGHPGAGNGAPKALTRAELYEEAKRLGIPGRSTMSKDALARAIQRARG